VVIRGAAWSGASPVARVEVSTDSGRTWQAARLGPDRARYGWRLFEYAWDPPGPGSHVLMARTTDGSGATQPFAPDWNPSGYQWNVVHQVRVEVGDGPTAAPAPRERAKPEYPEKVRASCIGCHESDIIEGQRLTRGQWDREVTKMTGWGAQVAPADREALIDFLAREFGTSR
jgi:mono/diheme cytochrome c family protein